MARLRFVERRPSAIAGVHCPRRTDRATALRFVQRGAIRATDRPGGTRVLAEATTGLPIAAIAPVARRSASEASLQQKLVKKARAIVMDGTACRS
jgi:hypothetical protein